MHFVDQYKCYHLHGTAQLYNCMCSSVLYCAWGTLQNGRFLQKYCQEWCQGAPCHTNLDFHNLCFILSQTAGPSRAILSTLTVAAIHGLKLRSFTSSSTKSFCRDAEMHAKPRPPILGYWMQPWAFILWRDRIQDLAIDHFELTFFCSILDCPFVEKGYQVVWPIGLSQSGINMAYCSLAEWKPPPPHYMKVLLLKCQHISDFLCIAGCKYDFSKQCSF